MSYRPDHVEACRRAARGLDLSPDQAALLALAAPALAGGRISARVQDPDVGEAARMGWIGHASDHDAGLVPRLVGEGYLAWKTNRGWSHDPEGLGGGGRPLPSRQPWLAARAVDELGDALHALFLEGLEAARRKAEAGPSLLRDGYLARHAEGIALGREGFLERLTSIAAPLPEPGFAP